MTTGECMARYQITILGRWLSQDRPGLADASLLSDWLALLSIALMSVTIPTYAISVSFLGRERKRAISQREHRVGELQKKVKEFTKGVPTDPGVVALQSEIDNYNKEIEKIKGRVDSLSVYYAC